MVGARFSRASLLTNALVLVLAAPMVPLATAATVFEDDFNDGVIDTSKWTVVGAVENADCGANSAPFALKFGGAGPRSATTASLDVSGGGVLQFFLRMGVSGSSLCEAMDNASEGVVLQYSVDMGNTWTQFASYAYNGYPVFTGIHEPIPLAAQTFSTQFRWLQSNNSGSCCDHWAIDDVVVTSGVVPGARDSETLSSVSIDTPSVTVPPACGLEPCTTGQSVDVPDVPVMVPETPVPETCTPLDLVCVGPFTIPGVDETIPGQHVTDVPAICDAAGFACIDEQNIPSQHLGDTPEVTVAVDFTGLDVFADPHAGELTTIGPIEENVGGIPVTICASTCPFPVPPEGSTLGSATVTVVIDGTTHSQTVPLDASV